MEVNTMSGEARISSRIDPTLKKKANAVLKRLGIKQSQAITMFYSQIVENKGLPFDVRVPNADSIAALNELKDTKTRGKLKSHESVADLMSDLKS